MSAAVLWFTGLSGSGKTTIANELKKKIENRGYTARVFDGDNIRNSEHKHLGFTRDDIEENNRLISYLCLKNIDSYDFILVPIISPFIKSREMARKILGDSFIEIYLSASLTECMRRDVKGLYKKALSGEIENFIGLSRDVPYQIPRTPEIMVDTQKESITESVERILSYLKMRKIIWAPKKSSCTQARN